MEDQHLMFQAKARTKKWSVPGSSTENKVKPSSATRVLPLEPLTRSRTSPWMISASGGQSLLRSSSYVVLDLASAFLLRYIAVRYFPLVLGWLTACRAASWLGSRSCPMSAATRHSMTIYARVNDTAGFVHVQALPVPYFSWEHSHRRHHPQHLLDWARRGVRPKVQGGGPVVLLAVLQQPTWPSPRHRADAAGGLADLSRTQRIRLEPRRLCMPPQPERTNVLPEGEDPGLYLQRLDHGRILRYLPPRIHKWWFRLAPPCLRPPAACGESIPGGSDLPGSTRTQGSSTNYNLSEWDWLRWALATTDWDSGVVLSKVLIHNITDTQIMHHLFPAMPPLPRWGGHQGYKAGPRGLLPVQPDPNLETDVDCG